MKLVTLLRDELAHGAFKGETIGLADDVADKLVAAHRATYAPAGETPAVAEEPAVAPDEPEPAATEAEAEPVEEDDEPAKPAHGRLRKRW